MNSGLKTVDSSQTPEASSSDVDTVENGETNDIYTVRMSCNYRWSEEHIRTFLKAAASGDVKEVANYLRNDFYVNNMLDYDGYDGKVSALMLASQNGHVDCVKMLLQFGADVNQVTQHYTQVMMKMSRQNMSRSYRFKLLAAAGMLRGREFDIAMDSCKAFIDCIQSRDVDTIVSLLTLPSSDGEISTDEREGQWKNIVCFSILMGCPHSFVDALIQKWNVDKDGYNSCGVTPLICAIIMQDLEMMDYLMGEGVDVNVLEDVRSTGDLECRWVDDLMEFDYDGGGDDPVSGSGSDCKQPRYETLNCDKKSPLMYAVWTGKLEIVKHLLTHCRDIDPSQVDSEGRTALIHAIYTGSQEAILILDELLGYVHYPDSDIGENILLHAVKAGFDDVTEYLINTCLDDRYGAVDNKTRSAFLLAAETGKVSVLNLFLNHGGPNVNVNVTDENKWSALMYAAMNDHFDSLKLLLQHGADLDGRNDDGENALELVAQCSGVPCVELLIKSLVSEGRNHHKLEFNADKVLQFAVLNEDSDVLKFLLPLCKNVDAVDSSRQLPPALTPLMRAVAYGRVENATTLLQSGADVNFQCRGGMTAIFQAVHRGELNCLKLLIQAGADINLVSKFNGSLLLEAAQRENSEVLEILLKSGAKHINLLWSDFGYLITPLISAIKSKTKRVENIILLLKHGADIDLPDSDGLTPVMHAAKAEWEEGFQLLLKFGADPDLTDLTGATVMFHALGSWKCLKVLLEEGKGEGTVLEFDGNGRDRQRQLKSIHKCNGMHFSGRWNIRGLVLLFDHEVFQWDWYRYHPYAPFRSLDRIAFAAVQNNYRSPAMFERNHRQTSLLQEAFLENERGTIRYLLTNLFLTIEDYRALTSDSDSFLLNRMKKLEGEVSGQSDTLSLYYRVTSQPWRLETLSFLTISSSLSSSLSPSSSVSSSSSSSSSSMLKHHSSLSRSQQVDSLTLPNKFKSRLKFESVVGKLCPTEWASIGVRLNGEEEEEDDLLTVTQSRYLYEEDLKDCDEKCEYCDGCGSIIRVDSE